MKRKQQEVSGARRGFFRSVAALGALTGTAALILRNGSPEASTAVAEETPPADGYRETAHVRKYYDTARG